MNNILNVSNIKTESEIIKNWSVEFTRPVVSICCIAYNHELYIEEAILSFINQETVFPFEILIHDDASTDNTVGIIKKYEAKYPRIIKAIYQSENQYSKKIPINESFNFPRAKGKYIALCEGDDYFLLKNKLELNFKKMESDKDLSFIFSPALQQNDTEKNIPSSIRNEYSYDDIKGINLNWVLKRGGGFFPTPTCFFKADIVENLPYWYRYHCTGDYPLAIVASMKGRIGYIPEITACYRKNNYSVSNKVYTDKNVALNSVLSKYNDNIGFINEIYKSKLIDKKMFYYLSSKEDYVYYSKLVNFDMIYKSLIGFFKIRYLYRFKIKILIKIIYRLFVNSS